MRSRKGNHQSTAAIRAGLERLSPRAGRGPRAKSSAFLAPARNSLRRAKNSLHIPCSAQKIPCPPAQGILAQAIETFNLFTSQRAEARRFSLSLPCQQGKSLFGSRSSPRLLRPAADGPHRRREVGEGRTARQPGQVRKEAALTRQGGSLSNLPPSPLSFAPTAERTELNSSLRGAPGRDALSLEKVTGAPADDGSSRQAALESASMLAARSFSRRLRRTFRTRATLAVASNPGGGR